MPSPLALSSPSPRPLLALSSPSPRPLLALSSPSGAFLHPSPSLDTLPNRSPSSPALAVTPPYRLFVASPQIVVDSRRLTIILPINGYAVPFHVNTLKSVIKQEEGDYTVLRFMFVTPGAITGKKEDTPFEDPSATFIRGVTYRSTDSFRYAELHKEITDLKKAAVKRDNERKELADVVEQDKLVEVRGASSLPLVVLVAVACGR